jgi:hypothetical protein
MFLPMKNLNLEKTFELDPSQNSLSYFRYTCTLSFITLFYLAISCSNLLNPFDEIQLRRNKIYIMFKILLIWHEIMLELLVNSFSKMFAAVK